MSKKTQSNNESLAIETIQNFVDSLDKRFVFITEKVSIDVRELIRTLRKNYWGVYDNPIDASGKRKLWQALTEFVCDQHAIKSDLDTKDIVWRATTQDSVVDAEIARPITSQYLTDTNFGEDMDDANMRRAIDGTVVWKVWEEKIEDKIVAQRRLVDLLNFYIDPTARSIAESPIVVERNLMTLNEIKSMSGWKNTNNLIAQSSNRYDSENTNEAENGYLMRDVWEGWGLFPAEIFGKKGLDINAQVVISGLESGNPTVHLIKENKRKFKNTNLSYKPFEESWAQRVPGRWYGKGPAEKVIELQKYVNLILNSRVTRHTLAQMGIWKVRDGSGITQKSISGLSANGVIKVRDMADIEQLVVAEAQSTYSDEDRALDWARKITGVNEALTGERLPASTPATNAVLAAQGAQDYFSTQKERDGHFYRRLFSRHIWPALAQNVKKGYIVRFFRHDPRWSELIERVATHLVIKQIDKNFQEKGNVPTPIQVELAIDQAKMDLESSGQLFIEAIKDITDNLEASIEATNEALDVGVMTDKLFKAAELMPQSSEYLVRRAIDILGVPQPPAGVQKNDLGNDEMLNIKEQSTPPASPAQQILNSR